jgi:hypothetical protein
MYSTCCQPVRKVSERAGLDQHVRCTIVEDLNTVILQRESGCSVRSDRLDLLVDREVPLRASSSSALNIRTCTNALYTRRVRDARCFATAHRDMEHSAVNQQTWGGELD